VDAGKIKIQVDRLGAAPLAFFLRGLSVLMHALVLLAVNKLLGIDAVGHYAVFLTKLLIFSALSRFGLEQLVVRNESLGDASDSKIYRSYGYLIYLKALALPAIVVGFVLYSVTFFHLSAEVSDLILPSVVIVYSINVIATEYLRAKKKNFLALVCGGIMFNFLLLLASLIGLVDDLEGLIRFSLLAILITCLISNLSVFLLFRPHLKPNIENPISILDILKQGFPFLITVFSLSLLDGIPYQYLNIYAEPSEVGVYGLVAKVMQVFPFIASAVNFTFAPNYVHMRRDGHFTAARQSFYSITKYLTLVSSIIIVLLLFSKNYIFWVLEIPTELVAFGSFIFVVLMVCKSFEMMTGVSGSVLAMSGMEKTQGFLVLTAVGFLVLGCEVVGNYLPVEQFSVAVLLATVYLRLSFIFVARKWG